ncbi:LysR family transcriptional regulator [Cupriavidus basilensis]
MDLKQLECFLAVARELHFGRAAETLYMSQSSVSEAIKTLERSLGGQLFDRTSRRVALTPLGIALATAQPRQSFRSRRRSQTASGRRQASRVS